MFKLLNKYKPESLIQKKQRLLKAAEAKKKGESAPTTVAHKNSVAYGLSAVTSLIEQKKAKLVAIAHDVEPVEVN